MKVKTIFVLMVALSNAAMAQYYSPQTYIPLNCRTMWTAECESAARMSELQNQKEMLDFMREQETNRSLEQINESNDRFWREFRLAK
jgi:hypothetical protein